VEALGRITIRGQSGGVLVWLSVWSKVQTTLMIINPALVAGLLRSAMATLLEQERLCGRQKAVWSSATVFGDRRRCSCGFMADRAQHGSHDVAPGQVTAQSTITDRIPAKTLYFTCVLANSWFPVTLAWLQFSCFVENRFHCVALDLVGMFLLVIILNAATGERRTFDSKFVNKVLLQEADYFAFHMFGLMADDIVSTELVCLTG